MQTAKCNLHTPESQLSSTLKRLILELPTKPINLCISQPEPNQPSNLSTVYRNWQTKTALVCKLCFFVNLLLLPVKHTIED